MMSAIALSNIALAQQPVSRLSDSSVVAAYSKDHFRDLQIERVPTANAPYLYKSKFDTDSASLYKAHDQITTEHRAVQYEALKLRLCESKIERLRQLKNDWDTYGAEKPGEAALENAKRALHALSRRSLLPETITATADESVLFINEQNNNKIYLEFFSDGDIAIVTKGHRGHRAMDFSIDEFPEILEKIANG